MTTYTRAKVTVSNEPRSPFPVCSSNCGVGKNICFCRVSLEETAMKEIL